MRIFHQQQVLQVTPISLFFPSEFSSCEVSTVVLSTSHGIQYLENKLVAIEYQELCVCGYVTLLKKLVCDRVFDYELTLSPWFSLLDKNKHSRVYVNKTLLEIISDVFVSYPFADYDVTKLINDYQRIKHCIQYQESDFYFVSRLLQDAGVGYYFEYTKERCTMILFDSFSAFLYPQLNLKGISSIQSSASLLPEILMLRDANDLLTSPCIQVSSTLAKNNAITEMHYPAGFFNYTQAELLLRKRVEQCRVRQHVYRVATIDSRLDCACVFEMDEYYVVTKIIHCVIEDKGYWNYLYASPVSSCYRPLQTYLKPCIPSFLDATVSSVAEDYHLRAAITFEWDENSSNIVGLCVRQQWAGSGYGVQFSPAKGDVVWVGFIAGDIDRPVIMGLRYCNSKNSLLSLNQPLNFNVVHKAMLLNIDKLAYWQSAQRLRFWSEKLIKFEVGKDILIDNRQGRSSIKAKKILFSVGASALIICGTKIRLESKTIELD